MLQYNEITKRKYIVFNNEPYEVLDSHVFRKQQRKPVNQTKLKNLVTGKVLEQTFKQSDKVEEAEIEKEKAIYIYNRNGEWWFHKKGDPSLRFKLEESVLEDKKSFLKEDAEVLTLNFNGDVIGVNLPIKMNFEVVEAPPNIKGNTSSGGTKPVTIETGATINTPLFIERGDKIEVNTDTGEYVSRVS